MLTSMEASTDPVVRQRRLARHSLPALGQIVHYHAYDTEYCQVAMVTGYAEDRKLDLAVFPRGGDMRPVTDVLEDQSNKLQIRWHWACETRGPR